MKRKVSFWLYQEKTEEIWLSHMTKVPTPTEKSKKQHDNTIFETPPYDN